jgi:hypothetical protein
MPPRRKFRHLSTSSPVRVAADVAATAAVVVAMAVAITKVAATAVTN